MEYREITVFGDGPPVHAHGEVLLDTDNGILVIHGSGGTSITFNFDHVHYFCEADEPPHEEVTNAA